MSDTQDLSKIVNLIMQNPSIIKEISALASKPPSDEGEEITEAVPEVSEEKPTHSEKSERRVKLLSAMKPYLSEGRAKSIDTVLTIADVLDAVRSK